MRVLVLGVCLWMSATVCSAQTPFDGQFKGQAGNESLTFTFSTDEGKVTGMVSLDGGVDTPVEWGFVKGDLIVFKVMREFQGTPQPFVYMGKLEGNKIAFGRRPEDLRLGRLREFSATLVP
jgi:hypothetical protein